MLRIANATITEGPIIPEITVGFQKPLALDRIQWPFVAVPKALLILLLRVPFNQVMQSVVDVSMVL